MPSRLFISPQSIQSVFLLLALASILSGVGAAFGQYSFKEAFTTVTRQAIPTLRERLLAPTTGKPFIYGLYSLAGASVFGVAMLCYYVLLWSSTVVMGDNAVDNAAMWPEHVRQRLGSTCAYLAGSVALTTAAGVAAARNRHVLALTIRPTPMVWLDSIATIVGTAMISRLIDYNLHPAIKHIAWLTQCAIMGIVMAPICYISGSVLMSAAWYTAGIVGELSAIAIFAPSDKFLNMSGPLARGLDVVFVSCLGTFAFRPNTALGAGIASIVVYGGLILFSAYLVHDAQHLIKLAEDHQHNQLGIQEEQFVHGAGREYDPINAQLSIYMDILNIFIRIAMILVGGGYQMN